MTEDKMCNMSDENKEGEVVMHHVKDYFCELPQVEFGDVEEALTQMWRIKQDDPRRVIHLFRNGEEGSEGENEPEIVVQSMVCSNLPLLTFFEPDGSCDDEEEFMNPKMMLAWINAKTKFVSDMAERIADSWGEDARRGWEIFDTEYETSTDVYLAVDPSESDDAVRVMENFNRDVLPKGYKSLWFDAETSMIMGSLDPKWEGNNFFKKHQIRKENKWYDARFNRFIDDLKPYLRKFR
ncbi:MAG: hypothetical protein K2H96_11150 [Muribaculaceae bacterium]|nr:hypothetical protein [Muribaculaceae bacterium]